MTDIAGSYITIQSSNIKNEKTTVRQLIDIVQSDIASSEANTRKSYEVFVSGVNNQNITSSLFQTVFDQDFTLGASNPLFDITIGSLLEENADSLPVVNGLTLNFDAFNKLIVDDNSTPMLREKVNIYKQFAQNLLGSPEAEFFLPHSANAEAEVADTTSPKTSHKKIRGAIFICFRRLFTRDNIQKGSIGIKVNRNAVPLYSEIADDRTTGNNKSNLINDPTSLNTMSILDDSIPSLSVDPAGGEVKTLKNADGDHVGCVFYDSGVIVLDIERVFDSNQTISGFINSVRGASDDSSIDQSFIVYGRKSGEDPGDEKFYYPVYASDNAEANRTLLTSFVPVDSSDTDQAPANLYLDTIINPNSTITGVDTVPENNVLPLYNTAGSDFYTDIVGDEAAGNTFHNGSLYPSLWTSGTIDEVLDHVCLTRFGQGETTSSMTFRNETFINSTFIFCRAAPSQLNYSTNPTFTDTTGKIVTIDADDTQGSSVFSFVTTIGLYNAENELLAVAKTSRPIEKNPSTDLSIRIRLDY